MTYINVLGHERALTTRMYATVHINDDVYIRPRAIGPALYDVYIRPWS